MDDTICESKLLGSAIEQKISCSVPAVRESVF